MKYDINKTAVIPYIIAERALWTVIEGDKRYKDLEPLKIAEMVSTHCPALVTKAETLFNKSQHFRMKLLDKRKDMRYTLEMFMEHWSKGILKSLTN
jgi:hypothetical protein